MKVITVSCAAKKLYFSRRMRPKQGGVVLFIALIALVAMSLAGIALMRSVDTGNLIAGNLAFKQSALHASDTGVELAFAALPGILATSKDANIANQYFATLQPVDSYGIPTTIAWSTVPCRNFSGATISCTDVSAYRVQYVIDRLCEGPLPVTDLQQRCYYEAAGGGSSKKAGAESFSSAAQVYYRATIRVTGPANTERFVQVIVLA